MISLILLEILLEIKNKENGFDLCMQYNNYFLYLPTYFELTPLKSSNHLIEIVINVLIHCMPKQRRHVQFISPLDWHLVRVRN